MRERAGGLLEAWAKQRWRWPSLRCLLASPRCSGRAAAGRRRRPGAPAPALRPGAPPPSTPAAARCNACASTARAPATAAPPPRGWAGRGPTRPATRGGQARSVSGLLAAACQQRLRAAGSGSGTRVARRRPQRTLMHVAVAFSVGRLKLGTMVISSSLALKYICGSEAKAASGSGTRPSRLPATVGACRADVGARRGACSAAHLFWRCPLLSSAVGRHAAARWAPGERCRGAGSSSWRLMSEGGSCGMLGRRRSTCVHA